MLLKFALTILMIGLVSPLSALSSVVNLNSYDAFLKEGFNEKWRAPLPDGITGRGWHRIKADKNGRPVRASELPFLEKPEGLFLFSEPPVSRFTMVIPFELTREQLSDYQSSALLLSSIAYNHRIYLNGIEIDNEYFVKGDEITRHRQFRNLLIQVDNRILKQGRNRLTIEIAGYADSDLTGFFRPDPYLLGPYETLSEKRSDLVGKLLLFLFFFIGLYHLLLYIRRRQEVYNLFFGLFSVFLAAYLFTRNNIAFDIFYDSETLVRIERVVLYPLVAFFLFFIDTIIREKISIFTKIYSAYSALLTLASLLVSLIYLDHPVRLWQLSMPLVIIYIFIVMVIAIVTDYRRFRAEGQKRLLSFGNVMLFTVTGNLSLGIITMVFTVAFDVLDAVLFNTGAAFTKYGVFILVSGIAFSLANRFLSVHKRAERLNIELKDLNAVLEVRVEERTEQLQNTLTEVEKLKQRQDGDYFLTTLLIRPLSVNTTDSETVNVDFFLKQKKEFSYRKKDLEIGGDICIAHRIKLMNKPYTVGINADAMGKSLQGAGGTLVLGAVFQAMIERTRLSKTIQRDSPERWLKNAYTELQRVFESFDGSMMMSIFLILIDEETGFSYFINAEHPLAILYRDRRASFLQEDIQFQKLGMPFSNSFFQVMTFQMRPGDLILAGSDGKDDIILEYSDKGEPVINEDETAILRHIDRAGSDLEKIFNEVAQSGELMDDFSLVKFEYSGPEKPLADESLKKIEDYIDREEYQQAADQLSGHLKQKNTTVEAARLAVKLNKISGEYSKALQWAEYCYRIAPGDSDNILDMAKLNHSLKRYSRAVDSAEMIRARQPDNNEALKLLFRLYGRLKRGPAQRAVLDQLLNFYPDDTDARRWQKKLDEIISD